MAPNEEEKIQDFVREALIGDPQRYLVLHAYPSSGMSFANLYGMLRFIGKGKERG
jgi:hypothetical protein